MSSNTRGISAPPALPMVKVCGICSIDDALMTIDTGATALGLNFWPKSPRSIELPQAQSMCTAIRRYRPTDSASMPVNIIAVCVDPNDTLLTDLRALPVDAIQIHSTSPAAQTDLLKRYVVLSQTQHNTLGVRDDDTPELHTLSERLIVPIIFATGIGGPDDCRNALNLPGELLLVDAKDDTHIGGTGKTAAWDSARTVSQKRSTILAGGLAGDNVAAAVAQVGPKGVDAASRLEIRPGHKDPRKVRDFVDAARAALGM